MKLSTILDHIDSGHMALPEFQRGYVWNRDQVRGLMLSLYKGHPVGGLLVWATESLGAPARGDGPLAPGVVKLLLDGQQRITSLYGIIRGHAPKFFDGNANTFTGLFFHLETEEFSFFMPTKMQGDPLWVDVTRLMKEGIGPAMAAITASPDHAPKLVEHLNRLNQIQTVKDRELHVEEVTGADKTIDVVVDIFNRVNSGGTKLSKGDLALAKICAEAPDARVTMKSSLKKWRDQDFHFDLDWLLRNVNTIVTGEAKFSFLHTVDAPTFADGLKRAEKRIDTLLNMVAGRLGLDHDRVLAGRYAFPVMSRYLDKKGGKFDGGAAEQDRLLFWYLQSAMWGRFSGSVESLLDKDMEALERGGLDELIRELRLWRGSLKVQPDHFGGWSLGARFYPVLYLLTRIGEARDWGLGLPLKANLLGQHSHLEVHHIFPKAQLYKRKYGRPQVNAVANFCFQSKETNLEISDRLPEEYFPEFESRHSGGLSSQWIPMDPLLWKMENYPDFLEARRQLLADTINGFLQDLLHGEPLDGAEVRRERVAEEMRVAAIPGGIDSEAEEEALEALNAWVVEQGLPEGHMLYELADPETGEATAVLDLVWPDGLQECLSEPVAVLLDESHDLVATASARGYRVFTQIEPFKHYVAREVLSEVAR
jgi:hypothetical protein